MDTNIQTFEGSMEFYFIVPRFGVDKATIYAIFTDESMPRSEVPWQKIMTWDMMPLTEWFHGKNLQYLAEKCTSDGVYSVKCKVTYPEHKKTDYRFWTIEPVHVFQAKIGSWHRV